MIRPARRIKLEPHTDLTALLNAVQADGEPRILERNGEDIAVIVSPEAYADLTGEPKSKRNRKKLLALAGAWRDEDRDELIERIYRHRHESPPSAPLSL
jgi:hypothetical protein